MCTVPVEPVAKARTTAGAGKVTGEAVIATANELAVWYRNDTVGEVVVHFPRIGYLVTRYPRLTYCPHIPLL